MTDKPVSPATRCIHPQEPRDPHGALRLPLYNTTAFRHDSTADLLDVVEGRKPGCIYTRFGGNPNIVSVEQTLAALEQAEQGVLFSAGMAAISSLFFAHGQQGVLCIGDLYGGTQDFLQRQGVALGIRHRLLAAEQLEQLEQVLAEGYRLVYFETPANPTLALLDIAALSRRAQACGALVAIDNTFATPVNQQPLTLGADLVLHSASKYLGGHSDLTAGVVLGRAELLAPLADWRRALGQMPAPETAVLLARSLSTLVPRVRLHNANALAVAMALQGHPRIRQVCYPGLPDFPGHALACRQMSGFGGMLSIELESGEAARQVAEALQLFLLAPSLGGVESLVTQPCTTSHHDMPADERRRRGISDGLLRLSVGLEETGDLIADLLQALQQLDG